MKFYVRDATTYKYYGVCMRKAVPEVGGVVTASYERGKKFIVASVRVKSPVITDVFVVPQVIPPAVG